MTEQPKYSIGHDIISKYEKELINSLPQLYPDETERKIVEDVLIPEFRVKLQEVFEEFLENRSKGRYGKNVAIPVSEYEISELCKRIDQMIEDNRDHFCADTLLKSVFQQIQQIRPKVKEELYECSKEHFIKILKLKDITDRQSLLARGPLWFIREAKLAPYGRGPAFCGAVLGRTIFDMNSLVLQEVADRLFPETEEEFRQKFIDSLALHGITDRQSLLAKGPFWFKSKEANFSPYGMGKAFFGIILNRSANITRKNLLEVADRLFPETEEEFRQKFIDILAQHGITDRNSFLAVGPKAFTNLDFPPYGKGNIFIRFILGKTIHNITYEILNEVADKLGFAQIEDPMSGKNQKSISCLGRESVEYSKQKFIEIIASHGITDRQSLLVVGSAAFRKLDFPPYGKGTAFARAILNKNVYITIQILEEIADKFGWEKLSEQDERQKQLEVLAQHGITDRQSLLAVGPIAFTKLDFPPHGKGKAFVRAIFGKKFPYVTNEILKVIADKLGWEKSTEEDEQQKILDTLTAHGITDRQSLLAVGPVAFEKLDFPPYGKGTAFATFILGRIIRRPVISILEEIADKLKLPEISEESKMQFLDTLTAHGITDRQSLLAVGSVAFKKLDFPPYGKGTAFARAILCRKFPYVTNEILEVIADKLKLPEISEESKMQFLDALTAHGITDRQSLLAVGSVAFKKLDFPPYGKGTAFIGAILGRSIYKTGLKKEHLEEIADILFPEEN